MKDIMHKRNDFDSTELLKKASRCKNKELKTLLKQVETAIERDKEKDKDLLMAKTIITARLTSIRN